MKSIMRIHVKPELCRGCQICMLACSLYHEGECNLGLARLVIDKDMERYEFSIRICQHCESPTCLEACPTDAMRVDHRGVVIITHDECVQCGTCVSNCPVNAILYSDTVDRYIKCDLCAGRDEGPLCVELCPVGALELVEVIVSAV